MPILSQMVRATLNGCWVRITLLDMQIVLNGQWQHVPEQTTVDKLLEKMPSQNRRVAVEINGEILPRSRHVGYHLRNGDRIEIVQAIGGG